MSQFPTSALLTNLWVTAVVAVAVMLLAWVVGVWPRGGRHDGADVAWGLGHVAIALTTLVLSAEHGDDWRRYLVTSLTTVWGLRLAGHLYARGRRHGEGRRYARLLAKADRNQAKETLVRIYSVRAATMWLVSGSVQLAQYGHGDTVTGGSEVFTVIGIALWVVGFGFETIGDLQLARFRANPDNHDEVLDAGLWRFTRHPNYFGDACVWWGLAILAWHHEPGFLSVFTSDVMTFLLVMGTGAKWMERTISARRPRYPGYQARTSIFIPLPPKRSAAPHARG